MVEDLSDCDLEVRRGYQRVYREYFEYPLQKLVEKLSQEVKEKQSNAFSEEG